MPISSWVVTYGSEAECRAGGAAFGADPRLLVGAPAAHRLPVASVTRSLAEEAAVYALLRDAPEVVTVELVFVDASDVDPGARPASLERGLRRGSKR